MSNPVEKIYNLDNLDDEQVSQVMFTQRRQQTDGASDFLRPSPAQKLSQYLLSYRATINYGCGHWGILNLQKRKLFSGSLTELKNTVPYWFPGMAVVLIYLFYITVRFTMA